MTGGQPASPPGEMVEARGGSLGDELQRVIARVEDVARTLTHAQTGLGAQGAEITRLHEALAVLEGRTRRHESGQDAARELRQQIGALEERLEQEAELRGDLGAAVERRAGLTLHEQAALRQQLEQLATGVAALTEALASARERDRQAAEEAGARSRREHDVEARVEALERVAAAEREAERSARDELARAAAAVARVGAAVDELGERVRASAEERRRTDEVLAVVRAERSSEGELHDLLEQQRAAHARAEQRFAALEETLEQLRRDLAASIEERLLLRQQAAATHEQLRALGEALEGQRLAVVEHFRRWTASSVESGRRQVEELERANRRARDLLVRLAEDAAYPPASGEPGRADDGRAEPA